MARLLEAPDPEVAVEEVEKKPEAAVGEAVAAAEAEAEADEATGSKWMQGAKKFAWGGAKIGGIGLVGLLGLTVAAVFKTIETAAMMGKTAVEGGGIRKTIEAGWNTLKGKKEKGDKK